MYGMLANITGLAQQIFNLVLRKERRPTVKSIVGALNPDLKPSTNSSRAETPSRSLEREETEAVNSRVAIE